MSLTRTLYSTQRCAVVTSGVTIQLPVKTVSIEESVAAEDILALGKPTYGKQVKEVQKFTVNIKSYISSTTATALCGLNIGQLVRNSIAGTRSDISLSALTATDKNAFNVSAILTKFAIDAPIGDFPTMDLTFEGIGYRNLVHPTVAQTALNLISFTALDAGSLSLAEVAPLGAPSGPTAHNQAQATIKSAKFSLDIPTEILTTIGSSPFAANSLIGSAATTAPANKYLHLAKLPLKYSMTVEGENVGTRASGRIGNAGTPLHQNAPALATETLNIGTFPVTVTAGIMTSRSVNQGGGDLGAIGSFTLESSTGLPA